MQTHPTHLTIVAALIMLVVPLSQASAQTSGTPPASAIPHSPPADATNGPLLPSTCSQSADENGDGHPEQVTEFRYDADGYVRAVLTDENNDGRPDWILRIDRDSRGVALRMRLVEASGGQERVTDCAENWCRENWQPICGATHTCEIGPSGFIEVVRLLPGTTILRNDFSCWERDRDSWRYIGLPPPPG